ncbi:acyl-CoA synthetase [Nocardioides mangrovicus]|uniref:Acyl-CoA synthetase n=1 Tax=Nocardioides mangrovicus TaxID=2478913 RepID=A0A3L8P2J4_9ACTN|nr:AMP-binding protein [Nocardioides mangrovicus]RLV49560.1 acyl-CoA synthetase [Nocardioides mangrovicus]
MITQPTGTPLSRLAEQAQDRFGQESTLVFEGARHTSAHTGSRARRFASGLADLGVGRGDRVAVCMANCPEVLETYQAVWRLGAVVTPLLFLLSRDELRHALVDSGAKVVVTTHEFEATLASAVEDLEVRVVVVGEQYEALLTGDEASLTDVDSTDLAALLYTGGTTGRAKGVMISHDALSAAAWASVSSGEVEPMDVSLVPLPLAHVYGLMVCTMGLHAVRPGTTVLMRWFDPTAWLELVQRERVEASALVPTMLRLIATMPVGDYDLSSLRRVGSGSAPLPAEVVAQWARLLPGVEIDEGYGCSETTASASSTPYGQARAGSVGRAVPLAELRIELPDGTDAGPGVDGEICVRTPALMSGYWNDPEATAVALRDGWFHTGDVGHLDDDGYLFIVDRLKDVIIRGGFNVYPRDVEEVLVQHPAVAVAAVVGRPDAERGEEVVGYVELHEGATATSEELVAYAREHLSKVKYPREVHVVGRIPLTSVGKLDRKSLRSGSAG